MTLRYVRSGAGGAGTGADWANAYLTLGAAVTASAAGDTIYVSEDHSETAASAKTYTIPGTRPSPLKIICVNHSGTVPPVSADLRTTASIATTGANAITFAGADSSVYCYGLAITAGDSTASTSIGLANTARQHNVFENCTLYLRGNNGGGRINAYSGGNGGTRIELINTTVQFANTSQYIQVESDFLWTNTPSAIAGATLPTVLMKNYLSGTGGRIELRGVDLSALGSGKTIFDRASGSPDLLAVVLNDCKIDAAVALCTTPQSTGDFILDAWRVAADGTNYRQASYRYSGTLTEETTIVRTGGASNGTTPIAWKIVTTANSLWTLPFECQPIAIWNDTTGSSVTVTIEGIWGGGAVPNNDDIWIEVEYLGSSGSPLASFAKNCPADILASNAALSAGTGTWGGSTTKFKMAVTFTPQQKGWIFARVKAAKASSTFYIDPKVTLS